MKHNQNTFLWSKSYDLQCSDFLSLALFFAPQSESVVSPAFSLQVPEPGARGEPQLSQSEGRHARALRCCTWSQPERHRLTWPVWGPHHHGSPAFPGLGVLPSLPAPGGFLLPQGRHPPFSDPWAPFLPEPWGVLAFSSHRNRHLPILAWYFFTLTVCGLNCCVVSVFLDPDENLKNKSKLTPKQAAGRRQKKSRNEWNWKEKNNGGKKIKSMRPKPGSLKRSIHL